MAKNYYSIIAIIGIFCVCIVFYVSYVHHQTPQKKLMIVCTTGMIADALRTIAGDTIALHCLMGPGVDPHLYRATQGDMHKLSQADVIVYNGLHLEGKLAHLFETMRQQKATYAVAEALSTQDLITTQPDVYDPHIWHDITLWIKVVNYISNVLIAHNPTDQQQYITATKKYLDVLQNLDTYAKLTLQKIPKQRRVLITAHDAFRYFGRAYAIPVVGLQGTSTDSEISALDVQKLAQYIVDHAIKGIFVESSVPHRSMQAVQQAVQARGWSMTIGPDIYSDALGEKGDHATYTGMMLHNINAIVATLE